MGRLKKDAKTEKPAEPARLGDISKLTLRVSKEVYEDFKKYLKEAGGRTLPASRGTFLHDVKFAHNFPHLQGWLEKCTLTQYGYLYFYGMTPE